MAATTWPVGNCNESGPGSIRAVIDAVTTLSGDTVDLSQLGCSVISLTTGELTVLQNTLTIKGPGANQFTIDGSQLDNGYTYSHDSRIFTHEGTGTLRVEGLTLTHGQSNHSGATYPALGGCIFSQGTVALSGSKLSQCTVSSLAAKATGGAIYAVGNVGIYAGSSITASSVFSPAVAGAGGAIYAKGNATIKYSSISGNSLSSGKAARGGGIRALGNITTKYATINANSVSSSLVADGVENTYKYATGGGLSALQDISVSRSTISNNTSNGSFAGIDAGSSFIDAPANKMRLFNSTISGNHADKLVGGVYSNNGTVGVYNSTIAFNTAGEGRIGTSPNFQFFGPGLVLVPATTDIHATLQSSVLSNNTYGIAEVDLTTAYDSTDPMQNNVTFNVGPANNLVRTRFVKNPVPNDTIEFDCPLLGRLRDNGGLTLTHALLSTSPAIDHGNNALYDAMNANFYVQDQRGLYSDAPPYQYPRESNGTADIGAFEVNHDDTIFDTDFERCPEIF